MGKYDPGAAEKAARQAEADAAKQQAAIAGEQWGMAKPIYKGLATEAQKPTEEQNYFKRMIGGMERDYGNVGANTRRTLAGRYQYGSGYEGEAAKNLELSRATGRAGAWQASEEARQGMLLQLATGGTAQAQQGYSSAGGMFGDVAKQKQEARIAKAGQIQSGANSASGCMCRNAIAVNELTREVVRFRDTFFKKGSFIDLGYKLYSIFNVPLVQKNRIWKFLMKYLCLKPLGAYADFFFGKNWYGFLLSPIGFFWIGLWVVMGATVGRYIDFTTTEAQFKKEVAQWVLQT